MDDFKVWMQAPVETGVAYLVTKGKEIRGIIYAGGAREAALFLEKEAPQCGRWNVDRVTFELCPVMPAERVSVVTTKTVEREA